MDISDIGFGEDDIDLILSRLFQGQNGDAGYGHVSLLHHLGRYLSIVGGEEKGIFPADPGAVHSGPGLFDAVSGCLQHGLGLRDGRLGRPVSCLGCFKVLPGGGFPFQELARPLMGLFGLDLVGPGRLQSRQGGGLRLAGLRQTGFGLPKLGRYPAGIQDHQLLSRLDQYLLL